MIRGEKYSYIPLKYDTARALKTQCTESNKTYDQFISSLLDGVN